jgi:hypothetical protein
MLYFGYLGEIGSIQRILALIVGFVAFFMMFSIIFTVFVMPKYNRDNYILFGIYMLIWSIYGVAYMFNEEYKNIIMNVLDCSAKCLVGLGLWVYYTKIIIV